MESRGNYGCKNIPFWFSRFWYSLKARRCSEWMILLIACSSTDKWFFNLKKRKQEQNFLKCKNIGIINKKKMFSVLLPLLFWWDCVSTSCPEEIMLFSVGFFPWQYYRLGDLGICSREKPTCGVVLNPPRSFSRKDSDIVCIWGTGRDPSILAMSDHKRLQCHCIYHCSVHTAAIIQQHF